MSDSAESPTEKAQGREKDRHPANMQFFKWAHMNKLSQGAVAKLHTLCHGNDKELNAFFFKLMRYYHRQMEFEEKYRANLMKKNGTPNKPARSPTDSDELRSLMEKGKELMIEMEGMETPRELSDSPTIEERRDGAQSEQNVFRSTESSADTSSPAQIYDEIEPPSKKKNCLKIKEEAVENGGPVSNVQRPPKLRKRVKIEISTEEQERERSVTSPESNVAVVNESCPGTVRRNFDTSERARSSREAPNLSGSNPLHTELFPSKRSARTIFDEMNQQVAFINRTKEMAKRLDLRLTTCYEDTLRIIIDPSVEPHLCAIESAFERLKEELNDIVEELETVYPSSSGHVLILQLDEIHASAKRLVEEARALFECDVQVASSPMSAEKNDAQKRACPSDTAQDVPAKKPTPSSQASNGTENVNGKCEFCAQHPAAVDCSTYVTADERRMRKKELNLCYFCLRPYSRDHLSKCPKNAADCPECGKHKGHPAFCWHVCSRVANNLKKNGK